MTDHAVAKGSTSDPSLPLLAAFAGGLLLGARPLSGRAAQPLATLAALAFIGFAARRPVGSSVRSAGNRRRSASVRFSFVVERPVEQVFAFCADFENFPKFIGSLRRVRDDGDGRSHWIASTPSGGTVEWECVTTKFVTNSVIGWRSVAGALVTTNGIMRFRNEEGRTCVSVAIDYRVADSSLSDALAALVARRRRGSLEGDFRRFPEVMPAQEAAVVEAEIPAVVP